MDEAETRQQLIDKKLLLSGWNIKDPSLVTEELPIFAFDLDRNELLIIGGNASAGKNRQSQARGRKRNISNTPFGIKKKNGHPPGRHGFYRR